MSKFLQGKASSWETKQDHCQHLGKAVHLQWELDSNDWPALNEVQEAGEWGGAQKHTLDMPHQGCLMDLKWNGPGFEEHSEFRSSSCGDTRPSVHEWPWCLVRSPQGQMRPDESRKPGIRAQGVKRC